MNLIFKLGAIGGIVEALRPSLGRGAGKMIFEEIEHFVLRVVGH